MNMIFDPLNLLLLGIALVVFWRLRSSLGTRTGNERPPFDPYAKPERTATPEPANGNVLRMPTADAEPATEAKESAAPVWTGYAPEGSVLADGLARIAAADPAFGPQSFVAGAKVAYEMIVDSFAKGDKAALKPLLAKDVFDGFAGAIDARAAAGHTLETRFVGIDRADLVAAALDGRRAAVTMNFVSEMITATRDRDGTVVEGDAKEIREVNDVWTFERDVGSRDPNWKLAATQAP